MAKLKVFISHSCKDAEQAGPPSGDAQELARRERLRYAKKVREEIVQRLDPERFEVLLDVQRLEPGDGWRAKLHAWLQRCDAALILFSPESVSSTWVRQETNILMHRRALRESVMVIPVFLGDFDPASLRAQGFDAVEALEVQGARVLDKALSDQNAVAVADQAVAPLKHLAPVTMNEAVSRWVGLIVEALTAVRDPFVERARGKAGVADDDWPANGQKLDILALHLINSPLEIVVAALKELSDGYLERNRFHSLATMLFPVWVDESAATRLVATAEVPPAKGPRIFALNGSQTQTAVDFVQRAWCWPAWQRRIAQFDVPVGEGQDDELFERLRTTVLNALGIEKTPRMLKGRLERGTFVLILGINVPVARRVVERIARDYEPATIIVMAGAQFERLGTEESGFVRVRPEVKPDVEEDVINHRLDISDLDPRP